MQGNDKHQILNNLRRKRERYKGSFSFCLYNFLLKYLEQMWGLKHEKAECYSLIVTCFNLKMHPFVLASATGKASE